MRTGPSAPLGATHLYTPKPTHPIQLPWERHLMIKTLIGTYREKGTDTSFKAVFKFL